MKASLLMIALSLIMALVVGTLAHNAVLDAGAKYQATIDKALDDSRSSADKR